VAAQPRLNSLHSTTPPHRPQGYPEEEVRRLVDAECGEAGTTALGAATNSSSSYFASLLLLACH
jgi:hypothetical protein